MHSWGSIGCIYGISSGIASGRRRFGFWGVQVKGIPEFICIWSVSFLDAAGDSSVVRIGVSGSSLLLLVFSVFCFFLLLVVESCVPARLLSLCFIMRRGFSLMFGNPSCWMEGSGVFAMIGWDLLLFVPPGLP